VLKPIIQVLGCAFYVLTLGLFALFVNAGLFWLTGWLADKLNLPFSVEGFWPAFWGALIVSLVSFVLGLIIRPSKEASEDEGVAARAPVRRPRSQRRWGCGGRPVPHAQAAMVPAATARTATSSAMSARIASQIR